MWILLMVAGVVVFGFGLLSNSEGATVAGTGLFLAAFVIQPIVDEYRKD